MGVAYRGRITLEDIRVDFEVEPIELPTGNGFGGIGFGVKEVVTLKGQISESERIRLERGFPILSGGASAHQGFNSVSG